jgi:exodeoxyribonuclease V alpha subunit
MSAVMDGMLYLPGMFRQECELAYYLCKLARTPIDLIPALTEGLKFEQPLAVENACKYSLSVLTGNPGTGKTTTCKMIVKSFLKAGLRGICMSPSAKAARRIKEVIAEVDPTNSVQCTTIHTGLRYSRRHNKFLCNRYAKLDYDFVILDEFPMASMANLLDMVESIKPSKTRLVLVGDPNQLPSVDPGNVGRDIIQSEAFPTVCLTHILRQGLDSGIVHNATRILNGDPLSFIEPISGQQYEDFFWIPERDEAKCAAAIVRYVSESIPQKRGFDGRIDIQTLSPGKKSICGTKNLNELIGNKLNPTGQKFGNIRIGDKVINRMNSKEWGIDNGSVGIAKDYSKKNNRIIFDFGIGCGPAGDGILELTPSNLDSFYSAWAFTIHSSQGSEFPVVIIPLFMAHNILLYRNLLFTGETRARKLCILTGDPKALDLAIMQNKVIRRTTKLETIIRDLAQRTSL